MDPVGVTGVWRCACSATSSPTKAQTQAASVAARIHPTSCSHAHLRMLARCSQPMLDIGCSTYVRTYVHRVWGLGTKRRRDSGPRIQAPGFRPPDSGPRPQDSGPRIQAPGPRLQPPRGAVLAWFECSFVRTHVCTCVHALRVLGPGSDMHCSSAATGFY